MVLAIGALTSLDASTTPGGRRIGSSGDAFREQVKAATDAPAIFNFEGVGNINYDFAPLQSFRLVFLRIHFIAGTGTAKATVTVNLLSHLGANYNPQLYTDSNRGPGADHWKVLVAKETEEPGPYQFQPGDTLEIRWTDPNTATTWYGEIGCKML